MKTITLLLAVSLLAGCSQLMAAFGLTPQDLAPSLKYCQEVQYARKGIDAEIRAKCTVPAG